MCPDTHGHDGEGQHDVANPQRDTRKDDDKALQHVQEKDDDELVWAAEDLSGVLRASVPAAQLTDVPTRARFRQVVAGRDAADEVTDDDQADVANKMTE